MRRALLISLAMGLLALGLLGVRSGCERQPVVPEDELWDVIEKPVLKGGTSDSEWTAFLLEHKRDALPSFESAASFEEHADALRARLLDEVFLEGRMAEWRQATTTIAPVGEALVGSDHQIQRLRFEVLPGLWTSAWLYEPTPAPAGRVPLVLSYIGHSSAGDATDPAHQARAIHLARQGLYVLVVEWFGNGETDRVGNQHMALNHFDLWGTNGVGAFTTLLLRSVDYALSLPHVDEARIAATGLSGGGWQSLIAGALDPRVSLVAAVSGFSMLEQSATVLADLGDSEQTAAHMHRTADYPEIAALVAPRPLLLTYSDPDSCCFRGSLVVPKLKEALEPVYALFNASDRLRFHINTAPGTHNYEEDNRRALYRMLLDHGFVGERPFELEESDLEADTREPAELLVGLPEDALSLLEIAKLIADAVPAPALPANDVDPSLWQREKRAALRALLAVEDHVLQEGKPKKKARWGHRVRRMKARIGAFTVPIIEVSPELSEGTIVFLSDETREAHTYEAARELSKRRVVFVDLLHFGEREHRFAEPLRAMLLASLDRPSLGVQVGELAAIARHYAKDGPVSVVAEGERSALIAIATAALTPEIAELNVAGLRPSFRDLLSTRRSIYKRPEMFVPDLAPLVDMRELLALVLPRPVTVRLWSKRRASLEGLADLAKRMHAPGFALYRESPSDRPPRVRVKKARGPKR